MQPTLVLNTGDQSWVANLGDALSSVRIILALYVHLGALGYQPVLLSLQKLQLVVTQ